MASGLTAEASVEIAAPVGRVWAALTDPTLVKQYFFGTELDTDWKVGGRIVFRGVWEGKTYEDGGTVLAFEPQQRLAYTYWSNFSGLPDTEENRQRVEQRVREHNGKTTVTISQDNVPDEESREHSSANWAMVLGQLKTLVEAQGA
ncbi:MAG: SRPBCC domain-containing protein [Dehalococcoidia bacterium]|nr:MAG: SRPBCC domain-containing protein [Dehalococcoidia bacterium]